VDLKRRDVLNGLCHGIYKRVTHGMDCFQRPLRHAVSLTVIIDDVERFIY
jgi:hypothetical protein